MRTIGRGRRALVACALVVAAFGVIPAEASAQRAGTFSCRATALRLFEAEFFTANEPGTPCRSTEDQLSVNIFLPLGDLGFVHVQALEALTQSNPDPPDARPRPNPGDGGGAQAGLAGVRIQLGDLNIKAAALRSRGAVGCEARGAPPIFFVDDPNTDALMVEINGQRPIDFDQPTTIPLGPVTVYINRRIQEPTRMTLRALEVDLNGEPILVVGESVVDYEGNPCAEVTG